MQGGCDRGGTTSPASAAFGGRHASPEARRVPGQPERSCPCSSPRQCSPTGSMGRSRAGINKCVTNRAATRYHAGQPRRGPAPTGVGTRLPAAAGGNRRAAHSQGAGAALRCPATAGLISRRLRRAGQGGGTAQELRDAPGLPRAAARRVRRLGLEELRDPARDAQRVDRPLQLRLRDLAPAEPGHRIDPRPEQPRPRRSLVVRRVAERGRALEPRPVAGLERRERPHPAGHDEVAAHRLEDGRRLLRGSRGRGGATGRTAGWDGAIRRRPRGRRRRRSASRGPDGRSGRGTTPSRAPRRRRGGSPRPRRPPRPPTERRAGAPRSTARGSPPACPAAA